MKDFLFGAIAGVILSKLPDWMREHRMFSDAPYVLLYVAFGLLILLFLQYPILRLIAWLNPRFYLNLNKFFAPKKIDAKFLDELADWEAKHHKGKHKSEESK